MSKADAYSDSNWTPPEVAFLMLTFTVFLCATKIWGQRCLKNHRRALLDAAEEHRFWGGSRERQPLILPLSNARSRNN